MAYPTKDGPCVDCGRRATVTVNVKEVRCDLCRHARRLESYKRHDMKRRPRRVPNVIVCRDCGRSIDFSDHRGRPPTRCPECNREYQQAFDRERRAAREHDPVASRRAHIRHRFGLSVEQYEAMLTAQGGACWICRKSSDVVGMLVVDHDRSCCPGERSCGKCVRALLCRRCNSGLGQAKDDPVRLAALRDYVRKHARLKSEGRSQQGSHSIFPP